MQVNGRIRTKKAKDDKTQNHKTRYCAQFQSLFLLLLLCKHTVL
jgi:hypothetical protein